MMTLVIDSRRAHPKHEMAARGGEMTSYCNGFTYSGFLLALSVRPALVCRHPIADRERPGLLACDQRRGVVRHDVRRRPVRRGVGFILGVIPPGSLGSFVHHPCSRVSLVFPYHTPANRAQKKTQLRRVYLCTRHPRTDGKGALAGQPHLPRRARQKRRGVAW